MNIHLVIIPAKIYHGGYHSLFTLVIFKDSGALHFKLTNQNHYFSSLYTSWIFLKFYIFHFKSEEVLF